MKATEKMMLKFLKNGSRFVVPIYQRTYSWQEAQCKRLWDDILRTGTNRSTAVHFVGSIVYVEQDESNLAPLLVIDGQQRLTTVTLLLEALARKLGEAEWLPRSRLPCLV